MIERSLAVFEQMGATGWIEEARNAPARITTSRARQPIL